MAVYVAGQATGACADCDARTRLRSYPLVGGLHCTNICTKLPTGKSTAKLAHPTAGACTQCSAEDSYIYLDARRLKDIAMVLKLDRLWFWFRSCQPILQPAGSHLGNQRNRPSVNLVVVSKTAGSCTEKQQTSSYTVSLRFSNC